jgi:hypothetical protein
MERPVVGSTLSEKNCGGDVGREWRVSDQHKYRSACQACGAEQIP